MTAVAKAWRGRLGAVLLAWAVCGVLHAAETDFAGRASEALRRIEQARRESLAATMNADEGKLEESAFMKRVVLRAVAATERAALAERRGERADDPAALLPVERRLVAACVTLDLDFAARIGCIQLAERELLRLRPWLEAESAATWAALAERVAAMDYHAEPEVPDGEELLARASNETPSAELFTTVEELANAHPDRLRAHFPRLILYRRAGREADLDRATAELCRRVPRNRSLRTLAADIRAVFMPVTPTVSRDALPALHP
jgi:hypothetical protein